MKTTGFVAAISFSSLTLLLAACGGGGGAKIDVDLDDDGLIEVATLQQLDWMRNDLAGTSRHDGTTGISSGCPATGCNGYELTADLDFDTNGSGTADAGDAFFDPDGDGSNRGWLPVGSATAPFTGGFDGNGHRISNLYISRTGAAVDHDIGLFGYVVPTGTALLRNVILDGSATAVDGATNIGLLVGYAELVRFSNIEVTGTVTGVSSVGGMVGRVHRGQIDSAVSHATVVGDGNTGGLVGSITNSNDFFSVLDSSSDGSVTGRFQTGGLIGSFQDSGTSPINNTVSVERSSSSASVDGGTGDNTGGLIGRVIGSQGLNLGLQINNALATGSVTSTGENVGGLIGYAATAVIVRDSQALNDVSGDVFVGGLIGEAVNVRSIERSSSFGSTSGRVAVAGLVGRLRTAGLAPNGATIESLINQSVSSGDVVGTGDNLGGMVGWAEGDVNIWSAASSANVTGPNSDQVGGFVGLARLGTISILHSHATGDVVGRDFVGGLVGSFNFLGAIGSITGSGGDVVSDSLSTANVTGRNYVGGLIGISYNVDHADCFATGTVTGNDLTGGLIGDINEGFSGGATLLRSFAAASVVLTASPTGATHRLGGLAGYSDIDISGFSSNHFATDVSGRANALGANNQSGGLNPAGTLASTLATLQAPTAPAFSTGGVDTLYVGWNPSEWDFGTTAQLPGIKKNGLVYRDGNADGTLD